MDVHAEATVVPIEVSCLNKSIDRLSWRGRLSYFDSNALASNMCRQRASCMRKVKLSPIASWLDHLANQVIMDWHYDKLSKYWLCTYDGIEQIDLFN